MRGARPATTEWDAVAGHPLDNWEEQQKAHSRYWSSWGWLVVLALTWLVFEWTADPMLTAFVACAKLGWTDLRTAWWLWRRDQRRPRAYSLALLFLALAWWRVSITAYFGALMIYWLGGAAPAAPVVRKAGAGIAVGVGQDPILTMLFVECILGVALALLLTILGFWQAQRHRLKIWLSPDVHRARERDQFPPTILDRHNHADRLAMPLLLLVPIGLLGLLWLMSPILVHFGLMQQPVLAGIRWQALPPMVLGAGFVGLVAAAWIGLSLLSLWLNAFEEQLLAHRPAECWPETVLEPTDDELPVPDSINYPNDPIPTKTRSRAVGNYRFARVH